jgi:hypothetical protein
MLSEQINDVQRNEHEKTDPRKILLHYIKSEKVKEIMQPSSHQKITDMSIT